MRTCAVLCCSIPIPQEVGIETCSLPPRYRHHRTWNTGNKVAKCGARFRACSSVYSYKLYRRFAHLRSMNADLESLLTEVGRGVKGIDAATFRALLSPVDVEELEGGSIPVPTLSALRLGALRTVSGAAALRCLPPPLNRHSPSGYGVAGAATSSGIPSAMGRGSDHAWSVGRERGLGSPACGRVWSACAETSRSIYECSSADKAPDICHQQAARILH